MSRLLTLVLLTMSAMPALAGEKRQVLSLDGTWQMAEGTFDALPAQFDRRVPVPGLVSQAEPSFAEVGTAKSGEHREAFWYRREFTVAGPIAPVALLRIHKAMFGTRVYLNGRLIGDHLPCFTPALLDVAEALRGDGQTNELVIRVGADRLSLPRSVPDGFDKEKSQYIPGIFDSVELIMSRRPRIVNVQTVPEIDKAQVRAVVELAGTGGATETELVCEVTEARSGKSVGKASTPVKLLPGGQTVELVVPIEGCRLWSPEDPFLYRIATETSGDRHTTRFGMRTFCFDPVTKQPMLNGKPYPLRGTNVCLYRFFEDAGCGGRPWREEWVRRLHEMFRHMHWNSCRYCIGFPPEFWYDVADETGILIQDEFPIWYGKTDWPADLKPDELVREYSEWMRERWNHPCVVIWDAQNETVTEETGKAIVAVRGLDRSNRPWDNGWAAPQSPTDVHETHPYAMQCDYRKGVPTKFRTSGFAGLLGAPDVPGGLGGGPLPNTGNNPCIINEYGWLWLNRDGSPTTLTRANYEHYLPNSTADQRREHHARTLSAKTEFWRCHRQVAGVLHFCSLGYSRPDGQTSDHLMDIEKLVLEPHFVKYVGDAFAPVGLMIDFWAEELPEGKSAAVSVVVINDLDRPWQGDVRLRLIAGEKTLGERSLPCKVDPIGSTRLTFELPIAVAPGDYQLVAELDGDGADCRGGAGQTIKSWRDVKKR